jgi:hypothetical protein
MTHARGKACSRESLAAMSGTDWMAVGAVMTGIGAAATAVAAGYTAWMAHRTNQLAVKTNDVANETKRVADAALDALAQDSQLLEISNRQAESAVRQAGFAESQLELARRSLIAASTPLLAPCPIVESSEMPPPVEPGSSSLRQSLLGEEGVSVVLPKSARLVIRKTNYPGRWERLPSDSNELAVIVALRNVGLGPAVVESAELVMERRRFRRTLQGLTAGVPAVGERLYVTFRMPANSTYLAAMRDTQTGLTLTVRYRPPSATERHWTRVSYWPEANQRGRFAAEDGWLVVTQFEVGPRPEE